MNSAPGYLLRGRDAPNGSDFCSRLEATGITEGRHRTTLTLAERFR